MRPNRKYQQKIRYAMSDMLLFKQHDIFQKYIADIIESLPFKPDPQDKDAIVITASPRACVRAAQRLVQQAHEYGIVDYLNERVYYHPSVNQYQETGIITYLEMLLKRKVH